MNKKHIAGVAFPLETWVSLWIHSWAHPGDRIPRVHNKYPKNEDRDPGQEYLPAEARIPEAGERKSSF